MINRTIFRLSKSRVQALWLLHSYGCVVGRCLRHMLEIKNSLLALGIDSRTCPVLNPLTPDPSKDVPYGEIRRFRVRT